VAVLLMAAPKRAEHEDGFDRETGFTPFSLQAG